jgi:hypothetical protein
MPARPLKPWRRQRTALSQDSCDLDDGLRIDPRHVGKRNDPARREGRGPHSPRQACTHAIACPGTHSDARAVRRKRTRSHLVAGSDDSDDRIDRGGKIPAGRDTHGCAVRQRSRQLVAAKARRAAGRQQDSDDRRVTLTEVGAALPSDPLFALDLLGETEVLGVEDFSAPRLKLTMRIKTAPAKQWRIARELRRRIKLAFDAQGIKLI